ncbi:hypothetical protein [Sphingobacterium siyangense]|uniref:hypothetical protein n=1 Tax=Sphingobacterium siyangense TaxID=459529 RepID=UPI002FDD6A1E
MDGVQLLPYTGYFWRVRLWDENEKSLRSPAASCEMGQLDVSNWKGAWISDHHDQEVKPAPYFRKAFSLSNKKNKIGKSLRCSCGTI